jgi:hypothetical protein
MTDRSDERDEDLRLILRLAMKWSENKHCQQIVCKAEEALQESFDFEVK